MPRFIVELIIPDKPSVPKSRIYKVVCNWMEIVLEVLGGHYYQVHFGDFGEYKVLSRKQIENLKNKI